MKKKMQKIQNVTNIKRTKSPKAQQKKLGCQPLVQKKQNRVKVQNTKKE